MSNEINMPLILFVTFYLTWLGLSQNWPDHPDPYRKVSELPVRPGNLAFFGDRLFLARRFACRARRKPPVSEQNLDQFPVNSLFEIDPVKRPPGQGDERYWAVPGNVPVDVEIQLVRGGAASLEP